MSNLLLFSLLLFGVEFLITIFYWGDITPYISSNIWLSFSAFLRLITWSAIMNFLKRTAILSFWEIVKGYVIAFVALHVFKYPLIENFKNNVLLKLKNNWCYFLLFWEMEHKLVKSFFILTIFPILLGSIGFIFYLPSTRKIGFKTLRKKTGAKLILVFAKITVKLPFTLTITVFVKEFIKKIKTKIKLTKKEDTKAWYIQAFLLYKYLKFY